MNLNTIIPLTSASRLQSYLQRFCSRETFQLISFPLCGALPPTPLFHSLFLDSTIMKKGFLVKNVSPDFTNLCLQLFIKWIIYFVKNCYYTFILLCVLSDIFHILFCVFVFLLSCNKATNRLFHTFQGFYHVNLL